MAIRTPSPKLNELQRATTAKQKNAQNNANEFHRQQQQQQQQPQPQPQQPQSGSSGRPTPRQRTTTRRAKRPRRHLQANTNASNKSC
ncbi:hypothetical protein CC80DRAFT_554284 [Byssothecium circinans]|uniref:Uncharacterized protein n=1 Tax=Byssothecium circinans TaxID=147558 RepID=A0A6A5TDZ8_9PLEO|nr:hypothetical protein CC80DRAFT_554284 [Byssothecium circinans]